MTKIYCDSPIHKVSSLALAFIIIAFCVLPSFASADSVRPNDPVGWQDGDTFRDVLLATLNAWGISFSRSDPTDEKDILQFADELMAEFYEDNQTTQELFWDAVKYGVNQTGEILLDFLGVNKMRQFANWLVDKFSLSDNSSTPTYSPPSTFIQLDGVAFPIAPYYTIRNRADNTWMSSTDARPLIQPYVIPTGTYTFDSGRGTFVVTTNSINITYSGVLPSGQSGSNAYFAFYERPAAPSGVQLVAVWRDLSNYPVWVPLSGTDISSSNAFYYLYDNIGSSVPSSSIVINTTVINIPSDNDISPSDGIKIEVPGTNWGDSIYTILDLIERLIGLYDNTQLEVISIIDTLENLLENLQHSVTVENIPGAVTLDYDDYDIPLENEWGLFDIFFNTGGDDITLLRPWQELRSIIYGFPTPVLSFFALVVLFIVAYGFIRMGRDSH